MLLVLIWNFYSDVQMDISLVCRVKHLKRNSISMHTHVLYYSLYIIINYHKHSHISCTHTDKPHPKFAIQILEKNIWKEIKLNQKWSLEKDVLQYMYMHCFLKVKCTSTHASTH